MSLSENEAQSHKKHFLSPIENFLLKSRFANVKLHAPLLNENEFCTLERFRLRSRKHHQLKWGNFLARSKSWLKICERYSGSQMERFVARDCLFNDDSFTMLHEIIFFYFIPSRSTCIRHQIAQHRRPTALEDFYSTVFFCFVFIYKSVCLFWNFLCSAITRWCNTRRGGW